MQRTALLSISHSQHSVQQHITACLEVLWLGVFRFVVGDPVLAGHRDHAGRSNLRHIQGVVAGDRQERRERFIARVFKTLADQAGREAEDLVAPPFEEVVRIVDQ
jgi:hypothetical protein